jgi:phosphoribosylaminoimidazole-succinocarboxamide synthase
MAEPVLHTSSLEGLRLASRGKVRDVFDLGETLLIVTTDRLSAFDVVMASAIPFKGKVLNRLSEFWFRHLGVPNHMITCEIDRMPEEVRRHREVLKYRSMLVHKAKPFPIECVVRGYLIGSGWKDYQENGRVCGIELPEGLQQAAKLESPIFTPSTKAEKGHDENIGFDVVVETVGRETAEELRQRTLSIYRQAADFAETKGLILADTKFEFGVVDGKITLIDEVLTPDSSRYWPKDEYVVGTSPPSFDKQFVRDYLESIQFNKRPPGPTLPEDVIAKTSEKYLEAYRRLTGKELVTTQKQ